MRSLREDRKLFSASGEFLTCRYFPLREILNIQFPSVETQILLLKGINIYKKSVYSLFYNVIEKCSLSYMYRY